MKSIEIVKEFLGKVSYPIDKNKLVETAHNFGMKREIVQTVEALPDRQFGSLEEVLPHISGGGGGIGEKVSNVIGGAGEKMGQGESHEEKTAREHDHWEQDALARSRRKPSQAEGEREPEDTQPAYHIRDHEGMSPGA